MFRAAAKGPLHLAPRPENRVNLYRSWRSSVDQAVIPSLVDTYQLRPECFVEAMRSAWIRRKRTHFSKPSLVWSGREQTTGRT